MFKTILYFFKNVNIKLFLKLNIFSYNTSNLLKNNLIQFISIFYQNKNIKLNKLKFYFFFQKSQIFEAFFYFFLEISIFLILIELLLFFINV